MSKIIEGNLLAEGKRFALIVGRFNDFISEKLVSGALDALIRSGAKDEDIDIVKVPGAFEIPLVAKKLVPKKYDAIICLGAVIRGATPHFDYVSAEVSKGIATVSLDAEVPVIFGVITTDTIEQAIERAGTKAGNKGWSAAIAAIEMANLMGAIEGHK
ncbi:MAG: 6,7-dimethyl-8-ribityllumazine synthase [Desulfobacteraceae bacterium]|nr:6,7-dimethyl-8-ribityllumazine synthase [Desulfobacteraceae bacterium]MBC2754402.1 6,7-dimethyl-8-ribityllumazine synthase [Desulfobacteraceae bacterium]